jgi:hypothetical protein
VADEGDIRDQVEFVFELGAPVSEGAALEAAIGSDSRINAVRPRGSKGAAEVLLQFVALNRADAVRQAREAYAALRANAGLGPAEALYGFAGEATLGA